MTKRDDLEHLLRYMARPPLCQGRLMLREDGKDICLRLRARCPGARSGTEDGPALMLTDLVAPMPSLVLHVPHVPR